MELEKYTASLQDKSKNTIRTYVSNYIRMRKHFDKDISEIPNGDIIAHIDAQTSSNTKNGFLTMCIQVKRMNGIDITDLLDYREINRVNLLSENKQKNEVLQDVLPDYSTLVDYTERLFDTGDYEAFVVNFLLLNYHTRNLDLDFDIVTKLDDALDANTNYIVIMPKYNLFIRNRYKTASFYGSKSHKIVDDKFMFAIKKIYQTLKKRDSPDYVNPIVPNQKTIGYRIQSLTYKKLGEGNYVKICINHFREDLDELKKIAENRGTNINLIISDYDIKNVEDKIEIKE